MIFPLFQIESLIESFSNLLKISPNILPNLNKIKELLDECRNDIKLNVADFQSSLIQIETKIFYDPSKIAQTLNFDKGFSIDYKTNNYNVNTKVKYYNFVNIDNQEESKNDCSNEENHDLNENSSYKNPSYETCKVKFEEIKVECTENFANIETTHKYNKINAKLLATEDLTSEKQENKQFSCDICNKVFLNRSTLSNHLKKERCQTKLIAAKDKNFKVSFKF